MEHPQAAANLLPTLRAPQALPDLRQALEGLPLHLTPIGEDGDPQGLGMPLCRACHQLVHRVR
jgi:hypothetical protein